VDYYGATNILSWNSGDASPRTVTITLTNTGTVGHQQTIPSLPVQSHAEWREHAGAVLCRHAPTNSITIATLTITNDNSYGAFQFSAPSYVVNENGGYATITVLRTGGIAGPCFRQFRHQPGATLPRLVQLSRRPVARLSLPPTRPPPASTCRFRMMGAGSPQFLFQCDLVESQPTRRWVRPAMPRSIFWMPLPTTWPPGSQDNSLRRA
jgi:hypothetical protein